MFVEILACYSALQTWKQNSETKPLSPASVASRKEFLRIYAPSCCRSLFPEETVLVFPRACRVEVIEKLASQQPFCPFQLLFAELRPVEIHDPNQIVLRDNELYIRPPEEDFEGPVESVKHWIDLAKIRHIEWLDLQRTIVIEFWG